MGEALEAGREPSNAAAVWGYGAADCGFADAGRVKLGAGRPNRGRRRGGRVSEKGPKSGANLRAGYSRKRWAEPVVQFLA